MFYIWFLKLSESLTTVSREFSVLCSFKVENLTLQKVLFSFLTLFKQLLSAVPKYIKKRSHLIEQVNRLSENICIYYVFEDLWNPLQKKNYMESIL